MQVITLSVAENGLIKTISDDNINAAGEAFEMIKVSEFKTNEDKIKFLKDLCLDLGINLGHTASQHVITIKEEWGQNYKPNLEQINEKIKKLQNEIQRLERMR